MFQRTTYVPAGLQILAKWSIKFGHEQIILFHNSQNIIYNKYFAFRTVRFYEKITNECIMKSQSRDKWIVQDIKSK